MCGIDTIIYPIDVSHQDDHHQHLSPDAIKRRGPDAQKNITIRLTGKWAGSFTSSVLHLRGHQPIIQPVVSENFVLQWNGEIYDGLPVRKLFEGSNHLIDGPV